MTVIKTTLFSKRKVYWESYTAGNKCLFSLETGTITYSQIKGLEMITTQVQMSSVFSRLISILVTEEARISEL